MLGRSMASLVRVLCAPSGARRACLPVFRALALVACLLARSFAFVRSASQPYIRGYSVCQCACRA